MSHLIALAHEVAGIRLRYTNIHDAVFRFSLRRTLSPANSHKTADYHAHAEVLGVLQAELRDIEADLAGLCASELPIRSGKEMLSILEKYTASLADTIGKLQAICEKLCQEEEKITDYTTTQYALDRIAYDDAIQQYKRWGKRLDALFSTF